MFKRWLTTLLFTSTVLFAPAMTYADNSQTISFQDWVERLKIQALRQGISQDTVALSFLEIKQTNHSASFTPKTTKLFLDQYLGMALSTQHLAYEKNLLNHYSNILFEISHLFGVEPEVLIAVWSLENLEKKDKKTFNAIELMVSTTFNQPTNKQARDELFHALKLIDNKQVNPNKFTSDENGLLGSTFFKPSILRNYGIDFDGDGLIDIWNNYADILASTANYLSSIGWKAKLNWGMEIMLPEDLAIDTIDSNIQRTINYWHTQGVRLKDGKDLPLDGTLASIIKPEPFSDKTLLVLDNYFALLRWKRSPAFALAVGLTIDKLQPAKADEPATPFLLR